jgi:hypothetical protein
MVTTRKQTTKSVAKSTTLLSNGNGKTAPNKMTETAVTPEVLAQRIQTAISRKYKILNLLQFNSLTLPRCCQHLGRFLFYTFIDLDR